MTLYKEYRGFYESQEHIEGNPKKKEYFAVNLAGSIGDGGLALFQRLSGLSVRKKLLQTELSSERVINKKCKCRTAPAGATLCDSPSGTGVNASRTPQIRYGDAASRRGACKNQILVNDAIAAPIR